MLTGFNTNIRYRGMLFHAQTEDRGADFAEIVTQLYRAGTVLVSVKQGYHGVLAQRDGLATVRGRMQEQHKDVLRNLASGEFDDRIRERLGPDAFSQAPKDGEAQ